MASKGEGGTSLIDKALVVILLTSGAGQFRVADKLGELQETVEKLGQKADAFEEYKSAQDRRSVELERQNAALALRVNDLELTLRKAAFKPQ